MNFFQVVNLTNAFLQYDVAAISHALLGDINTAWEYLIAGYDVRARLAQVGYSSLLPNNPEYKNPFLPEELQKELAANPSVLKLWGCYQG